MTRAERLAAQVQQAKDKLDDQRKAVAKAEAAQREETRKALNKRRYHVGALADEAGLLAWSNTDLAAVFAVLARLADVPHPAALVAGLLQDGSGLPVSAMRARDGWRSKSGK